MKPQIPTGKGKDKDQGNGLLAMKTPPIISQQEWEAARQLLLVKEKALTRSRDALVTGTVFLGDCIQVLARLASGEETVAQVPRTQGGYQIGEAVYISWSPSDEMTFS